MFWLFFSLLLYHFFNFDLKNLRCFLRWCLICRVLENLEGCIHKFVVQFAVLYGSLELALQCCHYNSVVMAVPTLHCHYVFAVTSLPLWRHLRQLAKKYIKWKSGSAFWACTSTSSLISTFANDFEHTTHDIPMVQIWIKLWSPSSVQR